MLILMKVKTAMLAGAPAAPVLATFFTPAPPHDTEGAQHLASATFNYRAAGDFSRNGRPVEGPLRELRLPADLLVVKRQVTVADYALCVDEGACPRIAAPTGSLDSPVVGVSWHDASAYAVWMSRRTGVIHRLQSFEQTAISVERLRRAGLGRLNLELLYGLPLQTAESCLDTVAKCVELRSDRFSVFGYAHTASFKKHQLIGLGASAIGRMPQGFVQNVVATRDYLARIAEDRLTTAKGYSFMLVHFDPAAGSPKPRKSKGRSDQKHDLAGNDGFMAVRRRVCHTKVNCED
jgi:hypothetical protein